MANINLKRHDEKFVSRLQYLKWLRYPSIACVNVLPSLTDRCTAPSFGPNCACKFRAGLTIKHGTHVRRAPGWKGAPERHTTKFEHALFWDVVGESSVSVMSKFFTRKSTKGASNRVLATVTLSVTEKLSRRLRPVTHWYRESCSDVFVFRCAIRCTVYCTRSINPGPRGSKGPDPNSFAKSANRAPNDYAATSCHKVSNALRTLRGPPYRGHRLLRLFCGTVLMNWRISSLAGLLTVQTRNLPAMLTTAACLCISMSIYSEGP